MSESMEKILHRAFAKFLTDLADNTKTHPAIIEDYKTMFNTGKYVSITGAPLIEKNTKIQEEAKKRIDSMLEITTKSVDTPTVFAKATDSSLLLAKLKFKLKSLKEKVDSEAERGENAKKEHDNLTKKLSALTNVKSRNASLKPEALEENAEKAHLLEVAELRVAIKLQDLKAQEAELEKSKTEAGIAETKIRLQAVQEESLIGETFNSREAPRTRNSRRNSGTVFLLFYQTKLCFWCFSVSISA